jgi:hypothetical protein
MATLMFNETYRCADMRRRSVTSALGVGVDGMHEAARHRSTSTLMSI